MLEIPRPTTEEMLARHNAALNYYIGSRITEMMALAPPIDLAYTYDARTGHSADEHPAGKVIAFGVKLPAQRPAATPDRQAVGY